MRNFLSSALSLVIILGLIFYSFYRLTPDEDYAQSGFDMSRAKSHVQQIGQVAHPVGTAQHSFVRNYIVQQLQKMNLEVQTQEGFTFSPNGTLVKPINIITRIEGTDPSRKALLLLAHYDSAVHSAKGASDAGSGVATILESLRVFLSHRTSHENPIIILFTDAEELGLNGARLFVEEHPWAKDVGLVLNFEARGSGGPSNMIVETNGGNANLISAFSDAQVTYPVATSLMYSVYKMLPNDTDSTIFREQGDINSFFFAFIDDHYDYHTSFDNPQRLDDQSLAHQASYLIPTLKHFSTINLANLDAETDDVYFDLPFSILVHYPFSWVMPMLLGSIILFIVLVIYGFKKKRLTSKKMLLGFVPFLLALLVSGFISYFGWAFLTGAYPQYQDILHGFTYNGHSYIMAFVLLTLAILWFSYNWFKTSLNTANALVAPLFLWLVLCAIIAIQLQGASYFIIPVALGLISFYFTIKNERPSLLLLVLLNAPAIFIFAPLIQFFPVGLGLKMLVISSVFTVLLFGLLLSIFNFYKAKKMLGILCLIGAIFFFAKAHWQSSFSKERPKPNSLVYSFDQSTLKANWLTYDKVLDNWTKSVLGEDPTAYKQENTFESKYNSNYTFTKAAPPVGVPEPSIIVERDSANNNVYNMKITPKRTVNRIELYTKDTVSFKKFEANSIQVKHIERNNTIYNKHTKRWSHHVLTYYLTDLDTLRINFETTKGHTPQFVLYEASNTLLTNDEVPIAKRDEAMIPKPFVLNDAIISKSEIDLRTWDFNP